MITPTLRHRARLTLAGMALLLPCTTRSQDTPAPRSRGVRPGIEVLLTDSLHLVRGKRVGLITNHSGVLRDGRSSIDALAHAAGVQLTALFGPEHGIRGLAQAGVKIASAIDSATGVPAYSLYGETRVPTPEMLKDVDVLLYDIQDVGARVYTFQWTMALSAAAAGAAGKRFIVLDRPNPVRGDRTEGGMLDPKYRSFVGQYPVALRYGLTPGELLRYLVGTQQIDADVVVVPMDGWTRDMWYTEARLGWSAPSPNLRTLDAALLYTGTVFFEGTNVSEGRGTFMPFQIIGAPWLTDAGAIARELNAQRMPGVVFDSTSVIVDRDGGFKYAGERINAVVIAVSERDDVKPVEVGLHLLRAIYARHPAQFKWREASIDRLAGSDRFRKAVEKDGGIEELIPRLNRESREFEAKARKYWIYK